MPMFDPAESYMIPLLIPDYSKTPQAKLRKTNISGSTRQQELSNGIHVKVDAMASSPHIRD